MNILYFWCSVFFLLFSSISICKQNNVDLTQVLTKEQTLELKEGVAFLKELMPRLELADKAVLVDDDGETSIPKGKFVATVLAQLKLLSSEVDTVIKSGGKYSLNKAILESELNSITLKTPFAKEFREKIIANTGNSVESFVISSNRVIGEYEHKNGALLKQHYSINETEKPYKEFYKQKEVLVSDLENDLKLLTGLLDDCVSEAIDDPKFPPNIEKAKEREAKEKEVKEKIDNFKKIYESWLVEQEKICSEIVSSDTKTDSVFNMSKSGFLSMLAIKSEDWFKSQPELTETIRLSIAKELASDSVTIMDCVKAMSLALSQIKIPMETICSNWFNSPKMPSYYGLKTAIIGASSGTSEYNLRGAYLDWAASLGGALDSLKLSSAQQLIKTKLLNEFKALMVKPEISFLYPVLEKNINALGKEFPSLKELSSVWKGTLYDVVVNSDAVSAYYRTLLAANNPNLPIIVNGMKTTLETIASVDTVQRIINSCLRPLPEKKELAKGEPLNLTIYMKDGTILSSTIATDIIEINKKACAIPSSATVSATSGSSGYEFDLKDFFSQSPIENGSEGVTSYFEFKLTFSKNKGSNTQGSSTSNEYSSEAGWEKSVTNVQMKSWNAEYTRSVTGGGSVGVVSGEITNGVTIGGGEEWGTEETEGTFGSLGYAHTKSTSNETTIEKGTDTGYFLVKGYLYSYEVNTGGTLKVDVNVDKITTPNSKGFVKKGVTMTKEKTLRWAK